MILSSGEVRPPSEADVCVIGAGAAGITVARKLAANRYRVILCEAGGLDYSEESQAAYRGEVIGDKYFELNEARLRYFGGSTNHWGGWCRYLEKHDFIEAAATGNVKWPISKSDLDPYLKDSLDILEAPEIPDDEVLESVSLKRIFWVASPVIFSEKYRSELEQSNELLVVLNANLIRLNLDGNGVRDAVFANYSSSEFTVSARIYVLAAGGIENSRILLWNNQLAGGILSNLSPTLGRYWMEHPYFKLGDVILMAKTPFEFEERQRVFTSASSQRIFVGSSRKFQDEKGVLGCGLRLLRRPYEGTKKLVASVACVAPAFAEWAANALGRRLICGMKLEAAWEQEPRRDNRVELGREMDQFGIPRTRLYWTKSELDLKTPRETAIAFGAYLAEKDFGRVRLDSWLLEESGFPVHGQELAGYHHMGGTRMGIDPSDGIVDRNCKVFGQRNLYVAGSSVFPRGGHANPTLTIVQLALRLADHLRKRI